MTVSRKVTWGTDKNKRMHAFFFYDGKLGSKYDFKNKLPGKMNTLERFKRCEKIECGCVFF